MVPCASPAGATFLPGSVHVTLGAAVVGLGRIGAGFQRDPLRLGDVTHAGAYRTNPAVELIGGVDPDPGQRRSFEEWFSVPAFATLDELVAVRRPDLVSVCVPPANHAGAVLAALDAGAGRVVCEKPFTASLADADRLVATIGPDAARLVGVNYTRRFDPLHRRLLGEVSPESVRGIVGRYTAGIQNTASHWIANLLLAGGPVVAVLAIPGVGGADPSPTLVLRLEGGSTAYLEGHDVRDHLLFEMDVVSTDTRVQLLASGTVGRVFRRGPSPSFSGYDELLLDEAPLEPGMQSPMTAVIEDAVESLRSDVPMACHALDALAVHEVIDAARDSLERGTWVATSR